MAQVTPILLVYLDMAKKETKGSFYKKAGDGKITTKKFAESHKATTFKETFKKTPKKG